MVTHLLQRCGLLLGLNAFGGHLHAAGASHGQRRVAQGTPARAAGELRGERSIDLHRVEGNGLQVVERGVAGAEVIERQAEARVPQLQQRTACRAVHVQPVAFGHFQRDAVGGHAELARQIGGLAGQSFAHQLADGHVHVQRKALHGGRVLGDRAEREAQHAHAKRLDEAALLCDGHEHGGGDGAGLRAPQARQHLEAARGAVLHVPDGLQVRLHAVLGQRFAEQLGHVALAGDLGALGVAEHHALVSAQALGHLDCLDGLEQRVVQRRGVRLPFHHARRE